VTHFYATPEDLLPVLLNVEKRHSLRYTPCEHHGSRNIPSFTSATELPTLFKPAPYESAVLCPAYLVTNLSTEVVPRAFRSDGMKVWAIDQLENPDSVVISHGGMYGDNILLYGRVSTVHKTPVAVRLQRAIESQLRKAFSKIHAFRVGKQAEALLDSGARLTIAKQSPQTYDLVR
jgi:hypothetical protein